MDSEKYPQYTHSQVIRKSTAVMFVRLILFELLAGTTYLLLRIGLRFLDIQLDSDFSLNPLSLVKSAIFIVIEISVAGIVFLQWANTYYILTSKELKYISGIISKREMNYSLKSVQSVSFEQGWIGRILNFGSVKIYSPALQKELFLTEISNPSSIVETINQILDDDNGNTRFIIRR